MSTSPGSTLLRDGGDIARPRSRTSPTNRSRTEEPEPRAEARTSPTADDGVEAGVRALGVARPGHVADGGSGHQGDQRCRADDRHDASADVPRSVTRASRRRWRGDPTGISGIRRGAIARSGRCSQLRVAGQRAERVGAVRESGRAGWVRSRMDRGGSGGLVPGHCGGRERIRLPAGSGIPAAGHARVGRGG
jgi:hypothetical protein